MKHIVIVPTPWLPAFHNILCLGNRVVSHVHKHTAGRKRQQPRDVSRMGVVDLPPGANDHQRHITRSLFSYTSTKQLQRRDDGSQVGQGATGTETGFKAVRGPWLFFCVLLKCVSRVSLALCVHPDVSETPNHTWNKNWTQRCCGAGWFIVQTLKGYSKNLMREKGRGGEREGWKGRGTDR